MRSASSIRALLFLAFCLGACARASVESLHTLPISPQADSGGDVRGAAAAARALSDEDQVRIGALLVREFFRPFGGQVRLIDARPLADLRSADDSVRADVDWSADIARASALRRVCPADDAEECAGRPGGILRMSHAYAVARDTAMIFVRYTAINDTQEPLDAMANEMRFTVVRRRGGGDWKIASRLNAVGSTPSPPP